MPHLPIAAQALEQLPLACMAADDCGHVRWVNDAFCRLFAVDRDGIVGAPAASVVDGPREHVMPGVDRLIVADRRGGRRWLQEARAVAPGSDPAALALYCFTDLSEFESRSRARQAVVAGRDPGRLDELTGMLNRAAILQELSAEGSRSRRYGNALSAVLIRCRTDQGALTDVTLRALARSVNEHLRWVDRIGTLGRGEFLIVLPETAEAEALTVWEKIRAALAYSRQGGDSAPIEFTAVVKGWQGDDATEPFLHGLRSLLR